MTRLKRTNSRERGNMLFMTVMCVVLLLFTCIVAFAFYMLLSEQHRSQGTVDIIALDVTKRMNEADRIGQLNNIIEMNRELVYASRQVSNQTTNGDLAFCQPLGLQLLNEARASNGDVEKGRVQQIEMSRQAARYEVDKYNVNTKVGARFRLPWWQSFDPQVYEVILGSIKDTLSCVRHNDVFTDLNDWDKSSAQKFVHLRSNLYYGNIDAKLPEPDSDLHFYICSIPAPVETTIAPSRLTNPEVFTPFARVYEDGKLISLPMLHIPSAVMVVAKMDVTSTHNKESVKIGSIAACNGALPPIEGAFADNNPKGPQFWGQQAGWGSPTKARRAAWGDSGPQQSQQQLQQQQQQQQIGGWGSSNK